MLILPTHTSIYVVFSVGICLHKLTGIHYFVDSIQSYRLIYLIIASFFHGLQIEVNSPRHGNRERNDPYDNNDSFANTFTHRTHRITNGQTSFHRYGHQRVYRSIYGYTLKVWYKFANDQPQTPLCKDKKKIYILQYRTSKCRIPRSFFGYFLWSYKISKVYFPVL